MQLGSSCQNTSKSEWHYKNEHLSPVYNPSLAAAVIRYMRDIGWRASYLWIMTKLGVQCIADELSYLFQQLRKLRGKRGARLIRIHFWVFPSVSLFSMILTLKSFGNAFGKSCVKFSVLDTKFYILHMVNENFTQTLQNS